MAEAIVVRDLDVDFTNVPRFWLFGSATATAISNGVNMLFPHGERFFVRSVKYFKDEIDDPVLRAQIKAFFGQEGHHAHAHDRFNQILRDQGYEIDRFLEGYKRISTWLEKHTSPRFRLAVTAAAEHFTAIMAEGAFKQDVLDNSAPEMRALLAWHAAEEIEHKSVAFDVLQKIDPSYGLRVRGLAFATVTLGGFWIWGTLTLLRQDKVGLRAALDDLNGQRKRDPIVRRVFLRGIRQYLRRSFHPSDNHDEHLAAEWFAARGMSMPEAA
ncbi:MAG: metal-dependent hydrolase [Deltaproteobacteria bacterium]|nr:metal-dependent hydrolase [Deltaproteobacteria bacterium]